MTRLERLVDEQIAKTVPATMSIAVEKAAEAFAQEVMADETFRQALHEMVRRRSQALLAILFADEPPEKVSTKRKK